MRVFSPAIDGYFHVGPNALFRSWGTAKLIDMEL